MLERAHRACIDVDVGVELDHADLESARLQHSTQRSGRDTFTERGHHAPGDKNESRLMRRVGHGIGEGGGFRRFYALAGAPSKGAIMPMRRRSEEHTSELQSLMRTSYAVFCLQKTKQY